MDLNILVVDDEKDIREVFNKVVGSPPQTKVDDFERNIIGDLANANIAATKISESIEHSEKNYEETKNIDEEDEEFSEL